MVRNANSFISNDKLIPEKFNSSFDKYSTLFSYKKNITQKF